MPEQNQNRPSFSPEQLPFGSPYLLVEGVSSDEARVLAGKPEHVAEIEQDYDELRSRILKEVRTDETGIDTERIDGFLKKYNLATIPYLIVPGEEKEKVYKLLGVDDDPEHYPRGVYVHGLDLVIAIRDKKAEAANGPPVIEEVIIHEEAHANNMGQVVAYSYQDGVENTLQTRSGFNVLDDRYRGAGNFFEEGFATLMARRYVTEELGMKNGISNFEGVQRFVLDKEGKKVYEIPRSYFVATEQSDVMGGMSSPAHACYGMELLIAKDPAIFDAMLRSRSKLGGLKEFIQRVNNLSPGLYSMLRSVSYDEREFIAANRHIIDEVYGGDSDKALEAVIKLAEKDKSFTDRYLGGLVIPAPIEASRSVETVTDKSDDVLTPEQAKSLLKNSFGYEEADWMQVLDSGIATHSTRAEIIIALSNQPRSHYLVSLNLRLLEELDKKGRPVSGITDKIFEDAALQTPAVRTRLASGDIV